ncbi:MAG TPA: M43 family zinc metalloprotease [Hymenobacter sp.]|jgi:hypothetical protein|uniref:M43 family zinc metalloprotease n=1 Tax=Hymenobacter sp. TaxID=1898978 RepID=UPI002ED81FE3
MLKKLYPSVLTAALVFAGYGATAQSLPTTKSPNWCGTTAAQEKYFAENPGARAAEKALYERLVAMAAQQKQGNAKTTVADVTIPVVVHVLHSGGPDNISDRQINSALDLLNQDYQKRNADAANTIPLFQPIAANVGFQFRLAKIDPNGNCTTGITRHYVPNLINDDQSGAVQAVSNWDRTRYMNIWVVGSIGAAAGGNVTVGYVSPGGPTTANTRDGFTVRGDYFGDMGTSNQSRSELRAGTHEIGHYFGLRHPWGPTNNPGTGTCGDDMVGDTPLTDGTFSCNLAYAPCGPIANVQNFMDYASCATMFTEGQKTLMRNFLTTIRTSLTTSSNLVATGTNDGYVAPNCAPIASFAVAPGTSANVCINTPVTLRDFSSNYTTAGGQLTYAWSFPGGNPSTATGQTVSVSYPTAGFYSVTETVSNSAGTSAPVTVTNLIRVEGPTGGETAPFAQSFEDASFPNIFTAPTLRNYEISGETSTGTPANYRWARQTAFPAADGSAYIFVNNRVFPTGAVSTLITPNINLSSVPTPAVLTFSRAYALRTAASNDQLRVSFSSDCGVNWSSPTVFDVTALTTRGLTPIDGFVPGNTSDWQTLSVPIPAQFQGSGLFKVRLQMVNGSAQGNNFFLDNLRISGPLATKADALASRGISVYPNPHTKETAVHLNLTAATQVQVSLTDLVGRTVLTLPAKTYGVGQQKVELQQAGRSLQAGIYVVRIALNGEFYSTKLTVE